MLIAKVTPKFESNPQHEKCMKFHWKILKSVNFVGVIR